MEHYSTDSRDELVTDTGGVKENKEDKVLNYARLPEKTQTKINLYSVWAKTLAKALGLPQDVKNENGEAENDIGSHEQVLPFQTLLELLKLPPHTVKSNLPSYISYQWKSDPEELIGLIKAMSPTATMSEIITQLSRDIESESLHTFLYLSTPAHNVLPTPRLMELLKFPQDANPVELPSFILIEREASPKELLSRLEAMSKEKNILMKLMEENIIKENGQPQTKTEEAKSTVVTQPETTTKDTVERNTSAMEQVETPIASATQLKADVGEGVTAHADDLRGNKVHKLEENLEASEAETKNDVKKEPEEVVIKTNETEKEEIKSGESSDTPKIPQTETTKKDTEGGISKEGDASAAPVTEPQTKILERASFHKQGTDGNEGYITKEVVEKSKEKVIDEGSETKTIKAPTPKQVVSKVPEETKVSTTKVQERTESGSSAQTGKAQQNDQPPQEKRVRETHRKSMPLKKEQILEDHAEANRLSNLRDLNILKKHKMLEVQENQREQAKTTLQEETERQIKKQKNKKKSAKKAKAKEKQEKARVQANSNTKIKSLNNNLESVFSEAGLDIQEWIIYKAKPNGACASNCIAIALLHDEGQGQRVRRTINDYIVKHWEYLKQFMVFPHTQMVGKQEITFEEEEYKEFLSKDERSGTLWMDYTDLQAIANYFKVALHVLTTDVRNVKGSKPRWTHLEPDERMKIHSPIKTELPDVWMLHVDNTHFDLLIKKDNRLVTEGDLHQPITPGKQEEAVKNNTNNELNMEDPAAYLQPHTEVQQSKQKEQNIKSQRHLQELKKDGSGKEIVRQEAPFIEPHTAKNPVKLQNRPKNKDRKKAPGPKTQVRNPNLIKQESAKNDIKKVQEELLLKTDETQKVEIKSSESSDQPETPQTLTTKNGKGKKGIGHETALAYEPKLNTFETANESWQLEADAKLEHAKTLKEKGTKHFKESKFETASTTYQQVIHFLEHETSLKRESEAERRSLLQTGRLNLALCYLKLGKWIEAKGACDKAIEESETVAKAWFRRGEAQLALNNFKAAKLDFEKTLILEPKNKAAKNKVVICQQRIKIQKEREKRTYANMFNKFAEVAITKEGLEKTKKSVIDETPKYGIHTDSIQEQVDANLAATTKSQNAMVAECEVPETNEVIETTTKESTTDAGNVCITSMVNEVEPSVTKGPAMEEKDNSAEETTVQPKGTEENGETTTAKVEVASRPNPLTCESDEHLVVEGTIATISNSKMSKEEPNTMRMNEKSLIRDKDCFKEPNHPSNHEQAEQHNKDPIVVNHSPKTVTNLEIVGKLKPTRRRSDPNDRKTSDNTVPEGWKNQLEEKTKTAFLEYPDKSHSLDSKTELHNKSDTRAVSQEVSQRKDELKDEALKPNDDIHPTRRHEEVPSGIAQILIEEGNLSETPLPANKNSQTFANKVKETLSNISSGQKDKNIPKGWKQTRDENTSGNTFFPSPKNQQFNNRKSSLQYILKQEGWNKSQDIPHGWMIKNTKHKTGVLQSRKDELPISKIEAKESYASNNVQCELAALDKNDKPTREQNSLRKLSQGQHGGSEECFENRNLPSGWKVGMSTNKIGTHDSSSITSIGNGLQNRSQGTQPANEIKDTIFQLNQKGREKSQDLPHGWMTKSTKHRTKVLTPTKDVPHILKVTADPDASNTTRNELMAVNHNNKSNRKKKRHKKRTSPSKNNKVESNNATTINPKNKIQQWVSIIILITGLPMINVKPVPGTQSPEEEEFLFQVNDCAGMTGNKLNIQTFNGGTPPSCENAKIYEEPVQTPVQIMVLPDKHPVQFVNCKVHIKAISGMCDLIETINGRNVHLLSKIVYDDYYAPHPEECFKANRTGSITFQLPIIGSYPGEEITQKLSSSKISGKVFPYGEPGKIDCLGATWVDDLQNIQRQATLEIQYEIQIENVWGQFYLQSNKMIAKGVAFSISSANTFQRQKPLPKQIQIQYKDSVLLDQDRQALFVQVGEHASPEAKKVLDRAAFSSTAKLLAIAKDPQKMKVLNQALADYVNDPNSSAAEFASSGALYKRDTDQVLTYFHDVEEGIFVAQTETIPKDKCDSLREITKVEKANYYKSNNNQFKDTITFKDQSSSNTGFAFSINKTDLLCGIQVYRLPKHGLYLFKPNNTRDFIPIPSAEGRFLDKSISQDTTVITLLNSANIAIVSLTETIDEQVCELQRGITQNRIEMINSGAQHIQDQEGTYLQTKVSGEAIYTITCKKVMAKVRSMENVCCNELPIWLSGEDNTFKIKAFMVPHSKRTTKFCKARMCHPQFPAFYNVSNEVQERYYKVERGIPELTNYYPPPFEIYQIDPIDIPQAFALDTLTEDQRDEMSTVILEDGGREAVNSIVAVGTLHTIQQYIPEILDKANVVPKEMLEAAQTLFDISPMAGILNLLPKEAKMIISILSLLFVAWAGMHVVFLIAAFLRKYKIIGTRESFQSTFAPTVQIHTLTERTVAQAAEINNLQETIDSMQRNTNKTQAEIIDRLRALEDQKPSEENSELE